MATRRPWTIELTADGSRTLRSQRFEQACHSSSGAASETRHVSLELSGVGERLRRGEKTRVLEVGFGTGLGLLLTADVARSCGARLELVSLEQELLDAELLRALDYSGQLAHPELAEELARALCTRAAGADLQGELGSDVRYTVRLGDARSAPIEEQGYDACYLDPFSPDANPELWSEEFLAKIAAALRPGARLSSYCVQGAVRRRLQALGLVVEKRPGIGRKREVLVAARPLEARP